MDWGPKPQYTEWRPKFKKTPEVRVSTSGGSRKFWWGDNENFIGRNRKFKRFFREKSGGLQKKKKKKKKRSSPKLRLIFRPNSLGFSWWGNAPRNGD